MQIYTAIIVRFTCCDKSCGYFDANMIWCICISVKYTQRGLCGWPACLQQQQNPLRNWPDSSASVTGKKRNQTTHGKTSRELPCTMRPIFLFLSFLRWLDIYFHTSLLHIYDCPWEHFLFMLTSFINWTAVSFFLHVCQNNLWFIIYVIYDRYKLSKSVKRKVFWSTKWNQICLDGL